MAYGFQKFDPGISGYRGYVGSTMDPLQQSLYQSLIGGISANPAEMYSQMAKNPEEYYRPIEQAALQQFRDEVMPSIASRFAGRLGGSAAQGALARAGSDITSALSMQRQQMQQQALQNLLQLEQSLLNKPTFERHLFEKQRKPSVWDQLSPYLGKLLKAGGAAGVGFLTGGPGGAALGALGSIGSDMAQNAAPSYSTQDRLRYGMSQGLQDLLR